MHLSSLVQMGAFGGGVDISEGRYLIEALVSMSLRFGNLLKPISGLSLNNSPQSGLLLIMFKLLWIICLMFGLLGLKLVTMTGVSMVFLESTSSNWFWVY